MPVAQIAVLPQALQSELQVAKPAKTRSRWARALDWIIERQTIQAQRLIEAHPQWRVSESRD